ncbi:MAG TPA: hypothetical protein VFU89_07905, partial [Rhabdochlamydiaceae bacterium]|nr:hypothetical protein [Rhabdochlamydiaceae bacterium]
PPIPPSMTYPRSSVPFNPSSRPMTFDPKIPGLPTNPYLTMPGSSYPGSLAGAPFAPGSGQLPIPSSLSRPSSGNPASTAPSSSPLTRSFTLPSSSSAIPPSMSSSHTPFNPSNCPMTFDPKIPGLPTNPYLTMPGSPYPTPGSFAPGSSQLSIPSSLARPFSGNPTSSVTSTSPLPPFFTPSSSSSSILSSWRSYKPPRILGISHFNI